MVKHRSDSINGDPCGGRLLTAWSPADVLGPLIVNRLRESQIADAPRGDVCAMLRYTARDLSEWRRRGCL
jgi:hypothetical protein